MDVALRLRGACIVLPLMVAAVLLACGRALGSETTADLSVVTLFDGERGETLNTWGGRWGVGSMRAIEIQSAHVHSGRFALGAELGPTQAGGDRCLQCFVSGFGPSHAYCQTRDLGRFARIEFYVQNAARAALNCTLQVKDYRDSNQHRAVYHFHLPAYWPRSGNMSSFPCRQPIQDGRQKAILISAVCWLWTSFFLRRRDFPPERSFSTTSCSWSAAGR